MRLRRTTMERTTISFCLPFGDLCENVLCANLLCIYFLVDFFLFTEHVLLDIVGICFEGVRDSLLLLFIGCYIVVLVFGAEPSFSPTCLLCQHFWGFVLFCVRVFFFCFWVLLLLSSFVEVYFFGFAYLPHLGLVLLRCCVVVLVFYLYVLAGCLCVSVSVLSFCGEPCGGACGQGQPGGVNVFFAVCHNRRVWAKTHTSPQGEDFSNGFGFEMGHGRVQKTIAFSILARETL